MCQIYATYATSARELFFVFGVGCAKYLAFGTYPTSTVGALRRDNFIMQIVSKLSNRSGFVTLRVSLVQLFVKVHNKKVEFC